MSAPNELSLLLRPHPTTAAPLVQSLTGEAFFAADGNLVVVYRLRGDMVRLRIPGRQMPGPADGLWEHTCCELFAAVAGETAYREFNFSPSGQWAAYAFSDYRQRDPALEAIFAQSLPPLLDVERTAGRLELTVRLASDALPPLPEGRSWQLALAAVVEAADLVDGRHSYWSLHHPAAHPDFHHRDGFVLQLSPSVAN